MPKKIKFESYIYRFLVSAREVGLAIPPDQRQEWQAFLNDLDFRYDGGFAIISWDSPRAGSVRTQLSDPSLKLYIRGDNQRAVDQQEKLAAETQADMDFAKIANAQFFHDLVNEVRRLADFTG